MDSHLAISFQYQPAPAKMNNFIFILLLVAAYCGASPYISEPQNFPLEIVNGTEAEEGEFPYLVQLYGEGFFTCGGAIIGANWILTAAHCTTYLIDTVVYGTNDLYDVNPTSNTVKVKEVYRHPKFDMEGVSVYDVAVLELNTSIPFDDNAQPLKIADSNDVPLHVPGVLAGWGLNETDGYQPDRVQKVQLQLLDSADCAQTIKNLTESDAFDGIHNLCSDDYLKGQCSGDSGSPFVINDLIYGVVSWSVKPCGSGPGVFSRITNPEYRSFIKEITGI